MVAEGEWNQFKGKVQEKWGELTGSDLDRIKGRRSQLAGALQQRYGRSRAEALRDVDEFMKKL